MVAVAAASLKDILSFIYTAVFYEISRAFGIEQDQEKDDPPS